MGRTRDAILDALENLTADEFKKFKLKLLSVPLREGYGRIPRGTLMSMDAIDLTDKLVSSYLEEYSAELTGIVLHEMGMQETAEHLQLRCTGERAPTHTLQGPPPVPLRYPSPHQPPQHLPPGPFTSCSSYPLKLQKLLLLGREVSCAWPCTWLPDQGTLTPERPKLWDDRKGTAGLISLQAPLQGLLGSRLTRPEPRQVRPPLPSAQPHPITPHHAPSA